MNMHLFQAKHVEHNLRQKEMAKALDITENAMYHKECSSENEFKIIEMLTLILELNLPFTEFDAIFDHKLTKRLREVQNQEPNGNANK